VLQPPPTHRPPEIEEWTNRVVVHRLSAWLLPVAVRVGIHPNAVSILGLGFGLIAAAFYWRWEQPLMAGAGFAAMVAWHICDGLDGDLARATGKASPFGRVLDGVCDYATFIAVYLSLALSMSPLWLLLAVPAGVAHALQAAWYESARERYRGVEGRLASGRVDAGYRWVQAMLSATGAPIRRSERSARVLRRAAVLNANWRTIFILGAALLGHPAIFWVYELVVLSALTVFFARGLNAAGSHDD
jgi:phosphatidylglycerophosphate synthase